VDAVNAVTAVPTQAFVAARPVQGAAVRVDARSLQQAQVAAAAPVAPVRASMVGTAAPAQARPSRAAMERTVVAKEAPPPPPPSLERREATLRRQPGKPLDRSNGLRQKSNPPAPT
jgi:hypothetical protein